MRVHRAVLSCPRCSQGSLGKGLAMSYLHNASWSKAQALVWDLVYVNRSTSAVCSFQLVQEERQSFKPHSSISRLGHLLEHADAWRLKVERCWCPLPFSTRKACLLAVIKTQISQANKHGTGLIFVQPAYGALLFRLNCFNSRGKNFRCVVKRKGYRKKIVVSLHATWDFPVVSQRNEKAFLLPWSVITFKPQN